MADSSGSYDRFISRRGRRRKISVIQELVALAAGQPGIISLAPGSVDPAIFPFQLIEAAVENDLQLRLEGEGLTRGLGYTGSYGHPGLLEQLEQRTRLDHQPPYPLPISGEGAGEGEGAGAGGMRQVVGCGGHDLLSKVFDLLIDEGDPVLVEAPTFSGALAALLPLAPHLVGVTCNDRSGIDPTHLREILDQYKGAERRPRVLYTIPTGQNPTGATSSLEAKRAVYQLACEHDLLIIEDDPYFYLYFETEDRMMPAQPPSYLSLDVQHRVLRLDSLSKVLCPGLRIGWLTGPSQLVERVQLDMQATCMNPSNVSQALVHRLMVEWGREGWQRQVERLRDTYRKKRDSFEAAARKHLTNLCEWNHPAAGMFVWIRLIGVEDSRRLMEEKGIAKKVLFVPGEFFMPTNDDHHANEKQAKSQSQSQSQTIKQGGSYLRASYSLASPEDMDTALSRLADILREHRAQMTIIDTNKARA